VRLQTSSAGLAIGDADNRYLRLAGGTLTGELNALAGLNTTRPYSSGLVPAGLSDPPPSFPFETEWNNAGKNWTAVRVSVTNTASGSASKVADFQVGGVSVFSIRKDGHVSLGLAANFLGVEFGGGCSLTAATGDFLITARNVNLVYFNGNTKQQVIHKDAAIAWDSGSNVAAASVDLALGRDSAGVVKVTDGSGNLRDWKARRGSLSEYLDITEMSAPAAPAANTARLYVEDNGSGKTRLMVLFPTGAAQVLATEP